MNNDQLCLLALEATTNPDALPVLSDALQETGWVDIRVMKFMGHAGGPDWLKKFDEWRDAMANGHPGIAKAIATVLLFSEWPAARWGLTEKCPAPVDWREEYETSWIGSPECERRGPDETALVEGRDRIEVLAFTDIGESYEYDKAAVVRLDGVFYLLRSSGCSCPSPTETWYCDASGALDDLRAEQPGWIDDLVIAAGAAPRVQCEHDFKNTENHLETSNVTLVYLRCTKCGERPEPQ